MNQTLNPREIAFRHFWNRYPHKIAIAEARVAFAQALKIAKAEDIIIGAQRFAEDPNRDSTYTPYPSKWLNGQRWMDGPLPPRKLTPEELAEKAALEAIRRNDLERERSIALGLELEEMRRRAVPMPEDMRERIRSHKLQK
jgi:hypothetical protein